MAECLKPFVVKGQQVPCGKCPTCRARLVSMWSFRLMQQDKVSFSSHFITLTYDKKKVPLSRNHFMSLSKRDCQLFLKRLRKSVKDGRSIKYYLCGEYGGTTNRPHYHAIIFNCDPSLFRGAWGNGFVHIGRVSGASVGYTLKYIRKKGKIPMHANDDRVREFALMSKGLGLSYLSEAVRGWYFADPVSRMWVPTGEGKRAALPRYYKLKLFPDDEQRKRISYDLRSKILAERDADVLSPADYIARYEGIEAAFRRAEIRAADGDRI